MIFILYLFSAIVRQARVSGVQTAGPCQHGLRDSNLKLPIKKDQMVLWAPLLVNLFTNWPVSQNRVKRFYYQTITRIPQFIVKSIAIWYPDSGTLKCLIGLNDGVPLS